VAEADVYQDIIGVLKKSDVCSILSDAVVEITNDDKIPGTNLPVAAFVQVNAARIVAFNGSPEDDTVTENEPKGKGCGFGGYARAFQWMQLKYLTKNALGVATAAIIISAFEIIVMVLLLCQLGASDDDGYFEKVRAHVKSGHFDSGIMHDVEKFQLKAAREEERDRAKATQQSEKQDKEFHRKLIKQQTKEYLKTGIKPSSEMMRPAHDAPGNPPMSPEV
jgi:hypothetical protein